MATRWFGALMASAVLALTACGGGDDSDDDLLTDAAQRCSSAGTRPYIANGTACVPSSATPIMLMYAVAADGSVGSCTGFKVAEGRALTAAHCLESGTSRVVAALWDDAGNASALRATRWVLHPQYDESSDEFKNDVAVVSFDHPLPGPSMVVLGSRSAKKGQSMFVAGWGAPDYQFSVGSARIDQVTEDFLRITYDGALSNACPGDSGGPGYRQMGDRMAALGLVSAGTNDCAEGGQTFFTNLRTPRILDFIRAEVPGLEVR